MADPRRLTDVERGELQYREAHGDRSHIRLCSEDCPVELRGSPQWGTVELLGAVPGDEPGRVGTVAIYTPAEARRLARELLAMADHAEYGPGEFRLGEWWPRRRCTVRGPDGEVCRWEMVEGGRHPGNLHSWDPEFQRRIESRPG